MQIIPKVVYVNFERRVGRCLIGRKANGGAETLPIWEASWDMRSISFRPRCCFSIQTVAG